MYKLATKHKMGYKGKRVTDENVNSFPENLLKIWENAELIKKVSTKEKEKK